MESGICFLENFQDVLQCTEIHFRDSAPCVNRLCDLEAGNVRHTSVNLCNYNLRFTYCILSSTGLSSAHACYNTAVIWRYYGTKVEPYRCFESCRTRLNPHNTEKHIPLPDYHSCIRALLMIEVNQVHGPTFGG